MAVEGTSPLRLPAKVPTPVARPDQQPATVPIPAELPPELRAQRDANKVTAPLNQPVAATAFNALPTTTALNPSGEVLLRGKASDEVATLQGMLQAAGIRVDGEDIAQDRRFGPQTEAAVRAFQTQAGLTPDGKAGPNTKQALEANNLLVQAQQALATNTAEGAVRAKQLADQASAILDKLPPNEAKALREQAAGTKAQADQKAQELSQPTPEQLQQQEAEKAAAERTQKQNTAAQGVDGAIAKGKAAADAADQAATRAEQAAARAASAANPTDAAKAVDQAATALNEAKQQQAQAQAALEEAKKAQAEAPDPAALAPKVAEAQAQVDRANQAVARAQGAVQQAGQAVTARAEAEQRAQAEAKGKTADEAQAATTANDLLRHNEMAFNGALNNAMSSLQASAAHNGNPQGGMQYLNDAKEALNQTRENVEGIEAAAKRAEEEAAKAPNPAALAPQVAEAKAAAAAARAKLTEMEQRYQQAEGQAQNLLTQQAGGAAQRATQAGQDATKAAQTAADAAKQAQAATTPEQAKAAQATAEQALAEAKAKQAEAQQNLRQVAELARQAPNGNAPELQAKLQQAQAGLEQANQAVAQADQAVKDTKVEVAKQEARALVAQQAAENQAKAEAEALAAERAKYGEALQGAERSSQAALNDVNAANRAVAEATRLAQDPQATPEQRQTANAQAQRLMGVAEQSLARANATMAEANQTLQPNDPMANRSRETLAEANDTFGQAQTALAAAQAQAAAPTPEVAAPAEVTPEQATQALTHALQTAHGPHANYNTAGNVQDLGAIQALANSPEQMAKLSPAQLAEAAASLARVNHFDSPIQKEANALAAKFLAEAARRDPNGGHLERFQAIATSSLPTNGNGLNEASGITVSQVMAHLANDPNKPPLSTQDQAVVDRAVRMGSHDDPTVKQAARQELARVLATNPTPEVLNAAMERLSNDGHSRRDLVASMVEGMSDQQLAALSTPQLQALQAAAQSQGGLFGLFASDTTGGQAARARIEVVLATRNAQGG